MEEIVVAVKREYDKLNRTLSLEQYGPYAAWSVRWRRMRRGSQMSKRTHQHRPPGDSRCADVSPAAAALRP